MPILPFLPAHIARRIPARYEAAPMALLCEAQSVSVELGLPMDRALAYVLEQDRGQLSIEVAR